MPADVLHRHFVCFLAQHQQKWILSLEMHTIKNDALRMARGILGGKFLGGSDSQIQEEIACQVAT